MEAKVIDFQAFKQAHDTDYAYKGDMVEWEDYTGERFIGVVTAIEKTFTHGKKFVSIVGRVPIGKKSSETYAVRLEEGLSISGWIIKKKIIRKRWESRA